MADPKNQQAPATDWRAERLEFVRELIKQAAPDATEEAKWKKPANPGGVPTWSDHGIICTGEKYKDKVKLTFAKGAALSDPCALFNSSLDGKVRRAIDLRQGGTLNRKAFLDLVRAAVAMNRTSADG